MTQIHIYLVIFIASSVKTQLSGITSDNGRPEELTLALGPVSVSVRQSENTILEDTVTTEVSNSLLDSDELTDNETILNTLENETLTDNSQAAVEVGETIPEVTKITEPNFTLTTELSSANTDTTKISNESTASETEATKITTTLILANSSFPTSTSISYFSELPITVPPSPTYTAIDSSEITVSNNSTVTSYIVNESNSPITTPSSKTTRVSNTYKEPDLNITEATSTNIPPTLASSTDVSISSSHSTVISTHSTTTIVLPTTTTINIQSSTYSPTLCGENEVYSCLPLCRRTCNNPLSKILCRPISHDVSLCRRGCTCINGHLFEKTIRKCVKNCPTTRPL